MSYGWFVGSNALFQMRNSSSSNHSMREDWHQRLARAIYNYRLRMRRLLRVQRDFFTGALWHPAAVRVPGGDTGPERDTHEGLIVQNGQWPIWTGHMERKQTHFLHLPCRSQRDSGTLTTHEVKATNREWLLLSICMLMMRLSSTPSMLHLNTIDSRQITWMITSDCSQERLNWLWTNSITHSVSSFIQLICRADLWWNRIQKETNFTALTLLLTWIIKFTLVWITELNNCYWTHLNQHWTELWLYCLL